MAEYNKPKSKAEFDNNFKQKKPLMNDTEAFYESSRCLFCYDAPCIKACPTGIDIPLFIKQINTQSKTAAARTIFESNWLGNACGKICPTGVLCEGACVYNHQGVPPIQIGRLQNHATAEAMKNNTQLFEPGKDINKKVAIIGSGPAGIACACELRTLGFEVDIYEAKSKPSGLTVHGIAPYKITNEEVLEEIEYLDKQLKLNFIYNHPIKTKEQLEELEQKYDAIFLGIGLGATRKLNLNGEEKENVVGAVEFIETVRMRQHEISIPKRVVVIGGGNTAMDAASQAARLGADEVFLAYRRSKESMGAYDFEYDLAVSAGVNSVFNVQPIEVLGNGKVRAVKLIRTKSEDGQLKNIEGSEFEIPCDMVIKATGQSKQTSLLSLINHLDLDKKGKIQVNLRSYQTSNKQYFAGGDAVNGGAEVVNAAYEGKMAAIGIQKWLEE